MKSKLLRGLTLFLGITTVIAADPNVPDFKEVWDVLRENLKDLPEGELSKAAARGLIKELSPRVQLVTNTTENADAKVAGVSRKEVFQERFAFVRIGQVSSNLGSEFAEAWKSIASTNKVRGLVLDLRYAGGLAYQAAAETADHFVRGNEELVKVGETMLRSGDNPEEIELPIAVLVNKETSGAAEVLAGILREKNAAILIGSRTAGQARLFEKVKLSTGEELMIGKGGVEISGLGAVPNDGLEPDISVQIEPQNARTWYEDPYRNISGVFAGTNEVNVATGTNRVRRTLNEAELVRRHREGTLLEEEGPAGREPGRPVLMDPVLARALDLLKGVTTLKQLRPL